MNNLVSNKKIAFLFFYCLVTFYSFGQPKIEYGDHFIVFEAEAAPYPSEYWKLRVPEDPEYENYVNSPFASGISPVNDTYLQYIGPWQGDGENSVITYSFTCKRTDDYQLAMRLHQPLEPGEKGDAKNDFFVRMEGNFESTSKFSTNDLRAKHKFWGRGINQWGTAQYLEHKGSDFPIYRLVEGETYTLKLYGRSRKACVDFIILFSTSLNLSVNNQDFAKQNPELYRPGGPGTLSEKVAKILFPKTATYLSKVGETKQMDYNVFPSTAVDQSVTWSSSNERVAIVSQSGFITGISEGSATITATTNDGKLTAVNKMEVGRYIETFDNFKKYALNGNKYKGDNGFEWSINGNHTTRMNNTTSVQFNRQVTGIRGVNIPNGIGSFSVQIRHLFLLQNPRKTVLLINGIPVDSIENTTNLVYDFVVKDINVEGAFTLALKNGTEAASKAHTVMYDNLTWSPYTTRPSVERRREETQIILSLVDEANQLISYPNPVSDRIFIRGLSEGVYSVKVYALSGAELLTTDVVRNMNDGDEASIELSDLSKGTYLLDITGGDTHFKTQVVIR